MKLKPISILLALALLLCGCTAEEPAPVEPVATDFSAAGMTLTLTDAFALRDYVTYTLCCESADISVMALKEEYSLFEHTDFSAETSVEEYAGLVWSSNRFTDNVPLVTDGDLKYFEFDRSANGNDYTYRAYVFKADDGFWLVQFVSRADRYAELADTMHGYAATIRFEGDIAGDDTAVTDDAVVDGETTADDSAVTDADSAADNTAA